MGSALIAILTGAIIGWVGSVAMETDSQAGILSEIGVAAFSGLIAALALGQDYTLDRFLAAALGAIIIIGTLALARRFDARR